MAPRMCVWRRLGVRHKRLGIVKGVGRRASPQRLKNIAWGSSGSEAVILSTHVWAWQWFMAWVNRELKASMENKVVP